MEGFKEKAQDEWRQVLATTSSLPGAAELSRFWVDGYVLKTQRKYLVATGPMKSALEEPPFDQEYLPVPGQPLMWIPVKEEWRDLPISFEA